MACEWCWAEANRRVLLLGGDVSSRYREVVKEQQDMGVKALCPEAREVARGTIIVWQVAVDAALATPAPPPTSESERAARVADVGECCRGADPLCAGGCLVEAALRKRAATPAPMGEERT